MKPQFRTIAASLATLSCGLWAGGLVMLFLSVSTIFQTYDRPTAGLSANAIFLKFEKYQLILAAVAIASTAIAAYRSKLKWVVLILLLLALIAGLTIVTSITPQIDAMRIAKQSQSDRFKTYHGLAMATYTATTLLVTAAALLLPATLRRET